jgi:hypothetical protein
MRDERSGGREEADGQRYEKERLVRHLALHPFIFWAYYPLHSMGMEDGR